ncbi:MAG: acetyl-CoA hydrolase [Desulfarculaceae bacterium]|nr:acetyl-CoA hydrolase [Desulfarculaceae bacterium]MCF8073827.1 acetyl-CoA hydrolase [Desulfarculaceae bacterium]MCF8102807.1 acetyl-CoA hydrolase [Desulfarculaceae bacterium]MCF8116251.1 acetyl-CoA hydrolase [Desulfarculaceae bacterium]
MPEQRIRYAPLRDKICTPAEAAAHITDGNNLFVSGFTAGYPKLIPAELVKRAEAGEKLKVNIFAGASTGDAVDGVLARAGLVGWRRPYMSDRFMRAAINHNEIMFKDDHLSGLSAAVRAGRWGPVDVAVVEVAAVTSRGNLIPTLSVGNTPAYLKMADKIILEVSNVDPPELEGIHDIFMPEDPPWRMPIPIYRTGDRIGKPFMEVDPSRVVAVVYSQEADTCAIFSETDEAALSIAQQLLDFVRHEMKRGRLPKDLPWQSGVGDVANAVLAGFMDDDFFSEVSIYSEVLQDTVLDLIDMGRVRAASGSALTLSEKARERFFRELYRYKEKIVLRSVEISNAPEVIARLGVLAVNTALEIDIYGQVNSTHVMGSQMMNGIGGSGDFERNGAVSFMVTPSTAKNGAISAIVPMVSHVDHSEHSVDVIITEYGLVDTRNLTPRQVAEAVITRCAHPDYRELLWDYYERACRETGGHEPHLLGEVFGFHQRFLETGHMLPDPA